MKKTSVFLLAALALAGCTKSDYLGTVAPEANDGSIGFAYEMPKTYKAPARRVADYQGAEAAAKLHSQFIVWGEKGAAAETKAAGTPVFNNYVVAWEENTANTTESNTANWEYVGKQIAAYNGADKASSKVWPNIGSTGAQTIKYWDYSSNYYTFTAVSALEADITAGDVKIEKITETSGASDTEYLKGYTISLTATGAAHLGDLYVSDRKPVASGAYGQTVSLKFRNAMTKVRVGFYETIPGYSVTIKKIYGNGSDESSTAFMADFVNQKATAASTLNVTYYDDAEKLNQPKIAVTGGTAANTLTLGGNIFGSTLNVTSATPTYDQVGGVYTAIFPKTDNAQVMKIKLDYTLTSLDNSGEVIEVTGATAEVPAQYMMWRSNYAYTYIFKISDKSNGSTDDGTHVGLYPITFDAVVIDTEDGTQETITTVSEPSITTYVDGSAVIADNEYKKSNKIYATVWDGSALAKMAAAASTGVHAAQAYQLSVAATEAEVVAALQYKAAITADGYAITGRNGISLKAVTTTYATTAVPNIPGTFEAGQVADFTPAAAGTYVFVYEQTASSATTDYYEVKSFATDAAVKGYYKKNAAGTGYDACADAETAVAGTVYYERYTKNDAVNMVKVIKVVD